MEVFTFHESPYICCDLKNKFMRSKFPVVELLRTNFYHKILKIRPFRHIKLYFSLQPLYGSSSKKWAYVLHILSDRFLCQIIIMHEFS